MKDRQKIERDYREIRANIQSGVERIPYTYGKLPLEAQARLNRLVISGGLMFVYWDSLAKQKELAEIFVPLKTAPRVQTSYEASHRGRTIRSIHETLDEKGIPYYPEQSADERYAGTVLRVLIKATQRLKGTSTLRVLPRGELMDLKKLHSLSRNSDEFESNTGHRS